MQKIRFCSQAFLDQTYTVQRRFLYNISVSHTAVDHTWRACYSQLMPIYLEYASNVLSSLQQHCVT